MGRCIAIETARMRRALQNASDPAGVRARKDRIKASRARRLDRSREGTWRSLSAWLWREIRKTLVGARSGTEGQTRAGQESLNKSETDKWQPELGSIR